MQVADFTEVKTRESKESDKEKSKMSPKKVLPKTPYTPKEMVGQVLQLLYQNNPFYRLLAQVEGTVVYGSLLWRIVDEVHRANKHGEEIKPMKIMKSVIEHIHDQNADIDMFVPASVKLGKGNLRNARGGKRGGVHRGYGWLAYRHDKQVVEAAKEDLAKYLQQCKTSTDMLTALDVVNCRTKHDAKLSYNTVELQRDLCGLQIQFQIHQSNELDDVPETLLNGVLAPLFTVESLMWVSGGGVQTRFGVEMDDVIRHIQNREMRLVCPDELSEFLDSYTSDNLTMTRLASRLMKYKRYGFKLRLTEDDLKCKFLPTMIVMLMRDYISPRSKMQKKIIAKGGYFVKEDHYDQHQRELAVEAHCAQSLHNNYVASVVELRTDLPVEICGLVAEYAARADESIYHEDLAWQEDIRVAREQLACVLAYDDGW